MESKSAFALAGKQAAALDAQQGVVRVCVGDAVLRIVYVSGERRLIPVQNFYRPLVRQRTQVN